MEFRRCNLWRLDLENPDFLDNSLMGVVACLGVTVVIAVESALQ